MLPSNRDKPLRWTDEMCEERMSKDNVLQNRKINVLKKEARHHQRDPAQQHNITTSRIYPAFLQGKVNYTTCHYLQCLLRFSVLDISCHYKKKHANASKVAPQMPQHANEKNTQKTVQCHVRTKKYDYILLPAVLPQLRRPCNPFTIFEFLPYNTIFFIVICLLDMAVDWCGLPEKSEDSLFPPSCNPTLNFTPSEGAWHQTNGRRHEILKPSRNAVKKSAD